MIEVFGMASLLVLLWEISSELWLRASDGWVAVACSSSWWRWRVGWLLARGARGGSAPPCSRP